MSSTAAVAAAAGYSPTTDLLLSLAHSLNAALEVLQELNCRLNISQSISSPCTVIIAGQQQDLSSIITSHRLSTLETMRTLKSQNIERQADSQLTPHSPLAQSSRLQQMVAAEVAKNHDEINDEIDRLRCHILNIEKTVVADPHHSSRSKEVAELRDRIELAFKMLDKKADIFEMEKKANLSDLEKLLAMFLSGDQVLAGKAPIKNWKCISCDRRLISISKEPGGKQPVSRTIFPSTQPKLFNRPTLPPMMESKRTSFIKPKTTMFEKSYSCTQLVCKGQS